MDDTLAALGDEVDDVYEGREHNLLFIADTVGDRVGTETFDLFSHASSLPDLGMLDPKANDLELSIAGRDFTVTQSPGLLQSKRVGGTTGAAVWQTSIRVAQWLAGANQKFEQLGILNDQSTVLELGSGISSIVPCILAPMVKSVIATDQSHLLKTLQGNIDVNAIQTRPVNGRKSGKSASSTRDLANGSGNIKVSSLDWEEDDTESFLASVGLPEGVDVVIACDCIFNYALIEPFVTTCVDLCMLRRQSQEKGDSEGRPTLCLIAQHLRQSEVFEQWLEVSMRSFRVWRLPHDMLTKELGEGSGFAVHVAVLRT